MSSSSKKNGSGASASNGGAKAAAASGANSARNGASKPAAAAAAAAAAAHSSASSKPAASGSHKKTAASSAPQKLAHRMDRDYTATLQAQIASESKAKAAAAKGAPEKKQRKVVQASSDDAEDVDVSDAELKSALAKAARSGAKDGDDDDAEEEEGGGAPAAAGTSRAQPAKGQANRAVRRRVDESEESYKQRMKSELKRRKIERRKEARKAAISVEMAEAHAKALERRAAKQEAHLARQAEERKAKQAKLAGEQKELEGLTNKEKRKRKREAEGLEAGEAATPAAAKKPQAQAQAQQQKEKKQKTDSASSSTAAAATAPSASSKPASASAKKATPAPTPAKTSKTLLVPANLRAVLPKEHEWTPYSLHASLLRALLVDLKFTTPTPVQKAVLLPAIRDWKDVSAAATTGSGKTLAFGIPIVHRLLELQDAPGWRDPRKVQALILTPTRELALQIVAHVEAIARYASPAIGVMAVVGGISLDKQRRVLEQKHPAIIVATPGRLWELIQAGDLSHLSSMYHLRFLVLDEADRMVASGHFAELESILDFVERHSGADSLTQSAKYKKAVEVFDGFEMLDDDAEEAAALPEGKSKKIDLASLPADDDDDEADAEAEEDAEAEGEAEDQEDEASGEDLSAEAEAELRALQDKLRSAKDKSAAKSSSKSAKKGGKEEIDWSSFVSEEEIFRRQGRRVPKQSVLMQGEGEDEAEEGEDEAEDEDAEDEEDLEESEDEEGAGEDLDDGEDADAAEGEEEDADMASDAEDEESEEKEDAVAEQSESTEALSKKTLRRQVFLFSATLMLPTSGREDANKTKHVAPGKKQRAPLTVLDKLANRLTFQTKTPLFEVDLSTTHQVAATLQEVQASCVTEDKDYLVYYFLLLYPGKTLVFVNSISCLRRLVNLLALVKVDVLGLHAEMQQKARLKSLERFKASDKAVLVCTDVAARGLDIPSVPYIIHYQLPRTAEIYIHRAGRVARAGKDGLSFAIVSEKEQKQYKRLCLVLKKITGIPALPIDQGYMTAIRARMEVARKLDLVSHAARKEHNKREWFLRQAEAMEMELDEEELQIAQDDVDADGGGKAADDAVKKGNLQRELDFLLSKPLMHGTLNRKFYTLNAARGFDINAESAGIAMAGANALSKDGTIRAAQNQAIGKQAHAQKKLPAMLQQATSGVPAKPSAPKPAKAEAKEVDLPALPAKGVVVSLSKPKRKDAPAAKPEALVEAPKPAPAAEKVAATPVKAAAAAPSASSKKSKKAVAAAVATPAKAEEEDSPTAAEPKAKKQKAAAASAKKK